MEDSPTLYSYRVPYDSGAAPNPFWGICTLVICKPVIRRVAKKGDWVVGIGSKNSPIGDFSKHVVYAMKITDKMSMKEYDEYCRENCEGKIPDWSENDYRYLAGDCIYDYSEGSDPIIRKGVHTEKNKERDLGGKYALISDHFYYFGSQPKELPDHLQGIIKQGQGHKSKSNAPYVKGFILWIKRFKRNKIYSDPQIILENNSKCISLCSELHLEEAEADEEIGLSCERHTIIKK